jgi:hypothetical protein
MSPSTAELLKPRYADPDLREYGRCQAMLNSPARANRRKEDLRCRHPAGSNGFCRIHNSLAQKRRAEDPKIVALYQRLGASKKVSPITALLSLIHESAGNVEYYRRQVAKLERLVQAGKKEREEVLKIVVLYNEERDRLQRYVTDAMRIGIDVRQVRLSQLQAKAMAFIALQIVNGLVEQGAINAAQRENALHAAADMLRAYNDQANTWQSPYKGLLAASSLEAPTEEAFLEGVTPNKNASVGAQTRTPQVIDVPTPAGAPA